MLLAVTEPNDFYGFIILFLSLVIGVVGYFVRRLIRELDSTKAAVQGIRRELVRLRTQLEERTERRMIN